MAAFFGYLKTIIEMWKYIKPVLDRLKSTSGEERQRVANAILKASKVASTSSDTTEYEDIIREGRLNND